MINEWIGIHHLAQRCLQVYWRHYTTTNTFRHNWNVLPAVHLLPVSKMISNEGKSSTRKSPDVHTDSTVWRVAHPHHNDNDAHTDSTVWQVSYHLHKDNDKGVPTGTNMTCLSGEPRPIRRLAWLLITVWRRLMVILITGTIMRLIVP